MSVLTQDYVALPGSADAAVLYARTMADEYRIGQPDAVADVMRGLFAVALAHTAPDSVLNLTTMVTATGLRFELHYPNDRPREDDPLMAHRTISRIANAYGEGPSRIGRMIYAEVWSLAVTA